MRESRFISPIFAAVMGLAAIFAAPLHAVEIKPGVYFALSLSGTPKYGPDARALATVNPNAPKGGEARLMDIGGFDSLNPFIARGEAAPGLSLIYETLTAAVLDDPTTKYGLLAESSEIAPDYGSVTFTLRREARWSDGKPVTADDVVFSFESLKAKGAPTYRFYYANVSRAEALAANRVRFHFTDKTNRELPVIMGDLPVLQRAWWSRRDIEKTTLDPWPSSGPYRIARVDANRSILYERDPNWWGRDLWLNRGRYNFDHIRYDMYRDDTIALEAFKSQEYDFRQEVIARIWFSGYDFPAMRSGQVKREERKHARPAGMNGFVFNLRRAKFQDIRVRQALALTFDFEFMNRSFFFGRYKRNVSFFQNSDMAARGLPTAAELRYLDPLRGRIPDEVFTREALPPTSDGSGQDRNNLRQAITLLREAGWSLRDGRMRNAQGEALEIEFLTANPAMERIVSAWARTLDAMGVSLRIRNVDSAQYANRLRGFDFDMIRDGWGQSDSPGNEQRDMWGSTAADRQGSRNTMGFKNPAVDDLIERLVAAPTRDDLIAASRALDRVLRGSSFVIPAWHNDEDWIAYWDRFGRPTREPAYGVDFMAWWIDSQKDAVLRRGR